MKVTKDFQYYLGQVDKLSKTLPKTKQKELENILRVMLILLVSLKKSSNLGKSIIETRHLP